ncbi:MAG: hypothetical protein QGI93_14550, partial [Planctomycetota bacterium]|nr:hypothetical protein [Planctomycetota bacterium]
GRMALALDSKGIPVAFQRRVGSGITELDLSEIQTFGGPGLVPPPERVFAPQQALEDGEGDPVEGSEDD